MKHALLALAIVLSFSCTAGDPPSYDTHETFDAKVEQYRKDLTAWRKTRGDQHMAWRKEILMPAWEKMSAAQWKQHELDLSRKCGQRDASVVHDQAYSHCREELLNKLLSDIDSQYEPIDHYIERLGGEEPKPEYPKYNLKPSPPTEHEIQYERAQKECNDSGGQWTTLIHADGLDQYHNTMHCREAPPLSNEPRSQDRLLDYRITVSHDRRSNKVVRFARIPWEAPQDNSLESPGEEARRD